jgi:hypothetical protein
MNSSKFERKTDARKLITILGLGLMLLLPSLAQPASAQINTIKWSMSAAACVPNSATTRREILSNGGGLVSFRTNTTGTITLYCPLSDAALQNAAVSTIEMAQWQNGEAWASAVLKEVSQDSGDIRDLLQITSKTSCLGTSVGRYFSCQNTSKSTTLNFYGNYYYVEIQLQRDNATRDDDVHVLGVSIH